MATETTLPQVTVSASPGPAPVKQYLRKTSLIIGDAAGSAIDLSALRFTFEIRRGDLQTPNSARVRVYNVAPNTANKIRDEYSRVVIQAGYEGNYGIIFDGSLVQPRQGRENATDTYLAFTAADGDSAYNFAVVNKTLAAGSTVQDHINVCSKEMENFGVGVGYVNVTPGNPLPRGKVMFGMARDFLAIAAKTTSSLWSIQDGKLNMYAETAYLPGEIPKITPQSGLVGLPEQTRNGVKFRTLLNPSIKIGQIVELDNATIQQYEYGLSQPEQADNMRVQLQNRLQGAGFYYVMLVEHYGDTRGNDFYTEVLCISVDASAIDSKVLAGATQGAIAPPPADVVRPWL